MKAKEIGLYIILFVVAGLNLLSACIHSNNLAVHGFRFEDVVFVVAGVFCAVWMMVLAARV